MNDKKFALPCGTNDEDPLIEFAVEFGKTIKEPSLRLLEQALKIVWNKIICFAKIFDNRIRNSF